MYKNFTANPDYIYAKPREMITINDSTYKNLARLLRASIGEQEYFNGAILFDSSECSFKLNLTLLIYREPILDPADKTNSITRITDIVPIWWDCQTQDMDGVVWNDFSWKEFKESLF